MWQHSATLTLGSQKTAPNRWAEDSHWGKIPSSNHTEKLGMAEWAWDKKQLYACRRLTIIHALSSYWNGETWNKKRHGGREGGKKRGVKRGVKSTAEKKHREQVKQEWDQWDSAFWAEVRKTVWPNPALWQMALIFHKLQLRRYERPV